MQSFKTTSQQKSQSTWSKSLVIQTSKVIVNTPSFTIKAYLCLHIKVLFLVKHMQEVAKYQC